MRNSSHDANDFSFQRRLWEHLHRNIWEWQEIWHLSAWHATSVFQAHQRDEPRNLKVLSEFMESSSKWFSLPMSSSKQIAYLTHRWTAAFVSPGVITIMPCFHNTFKTLLQLLLTIHVMWCDLNKSARGFSYHYHLHAHIFLPFYFTKKNLKSRRVE